MLKAIFVGVGLLAGINVHASTRVDCELHTRLGSGHLKAIYNQETGDLEYEFEKYYTPEGSSSIAGNNFQDHGKSITVKTTDDGKLQIVAHSDENQIEINLQDFGSSGDYQLDTFKVNGVAYGLLGPNLCQVL